MSKKKEVSFWDWLFGENCCCGSRGKDYKYRPEEKPEEHQNYNHSNQQDEEITEEAEEVYEQEGGEVVEVGGDYSEDT